MCDTFKSKRKLYQMVIFPIHIKEIEAIQDEIERIQLMTLLNKYGKVVKVNLLETRKINIINSIKALC